MAAEPQQDRLPFEPSKKRQKPKKNQTKHEETPEKAAKGTGNPREKTAASDKKPLTSKKAEQSSPPTAKKFNKEEMAIPKAVSDRMARRMALFCGVPSALGIATFVLSYFIVSQGWFKLPNVAVLLVSMGFFGLGVLGLSYGVISASWDEEVAGSKLGWSEFTTNWGRLTSAWRSARQKNV